jgi:pepF/M3 family oligoendopeptidase
MSDTATSAPDRDELPRWDTDILFPSLGGRAYAERREALDADVDRLAALYDRHDIRGGEPRVPTAADHAALAEILTATNALLEDLYGVMGYVAALVTTDATDEAAAAEDASLDAKLAIVETLQARRSAWIARLGPEALAAGSAVGAEHAHLLRRAEQTAVHQMSEEEEGLLADLRLTGGSAWARLAGDLSARLTGRLDGRTEPVTVLRGYATAPDGEMRRRAYQAEVAAWETIGVPMAACLNGIKGEAVTTNRRRGWADALAPALFANAVSQPALEAMQRAAVASFDDFRRFSRAKARLLGTGEALAWWDMMAPVPGEAGVSWDQASDAVEEAFATFSPQLRALALQAREERWIDAGPRAGKRGGAFCMPIGGGRSRVLLNFDGSFDSVQTLAHELGHAYHNTNLAARPPLLRSTPMALAETASIFCETIMVQAGLAGAPPDQRLALLNVDLQGACQVVVDIHSRFLFESELFARREHGPLSVGELCTAMTDAQGATYGAGVDPATYHPWMWAVKSHYYGVEAHFYNWPYCFGLLFGIGLYARYQAEPGAFRGSYDDLLASTGTASAAELAGRFGIDITDEGFWTASLDVIRGRIDEFVRLVDARTHV